MATNEMNRQYFEWMYEIVFDVRFSKDMSYRRLLTNLHRVPFTYIIPMDKNRAEDGIGLRYRFGRENGYSHADVVERLDNRPCSVLEMMIALAIRCEEHIMEDSDLGDRTGQWFWNMIVNLGLVAMTDDRFDIQRFKEIIDCFLARKYKRNGRGGLFAVDHCRKDMRTVEIWYQMFLWLEGEDFE